VQNRLIGQNDERNTGVNLRYKDCGFALLAFDTAMVSVMNGAGPLAEGTKICQAFSLQRNFPLEEDS